jgi:NAD(P)H-flavin reductase
MEKKNNNYDDEKTHLLASVDSVATAISNSCSLSEDEENPCEVTIQIMKEGRPSVQELLKEVDGSSYPGVFSCGPSALIQDIHNAVEDKRILRSEQQHDRSNQSSCITVYDEVF